MTNYPSEITFFPTPQYDQGRFIKSEAGRDSFDRDLLQFDYGWRSREEVTLQAGSGMLAAGTVLGKNSSNKFVPSPATATDGSDIAIAILYDDIDATGSNDIQIGVIARDAEVYSDGLIYEASVVGLAAFIAKWIQLAKRGIIVRNRGGKKGSGGPALPPQPPPPAPPSTLILISTPSVNTQVGQSYSQTNVASGGTTPYTYSVSAGTLPTGTTLNASTGTVSGTPTLGGSFNYTIKVTDSGSPTPQTATHTLSGTIVSASPTTLTLTSVASAVTQVGQLYLQTNVASGGTPPYTYSVSAGTLVTGTTLNSVSGTVSGTPSITGAFNYTITVTDSGAPQTAAQVLSGTIIPATVSPPYVVVGTYGDAGAGGWTSIAKTSGGIFYVSWSLGSDTYDGTAPTHTGGTTGPVKTIRKGCELLTDGQPDWLLLRRGDTWNTNVNASGGLADLQGFCPFGDGGLGIGGTNASNPMLISCYDEDFAVTNSGGFNPTGSTRPRPVVQAVNDAATYPYSTSGINFAGSRGNGGDYVGIIGIKFYSFQRDPANGSFAGVGNLWDTTGIANTNHFNWRLMEDCDVSFFQTNIDNGLFDTPNGTLIERRNNIYSAAGGDHGGHSQGQHITNVSNATIEENLFDFNGFYWDGAIYSGNIFDRNLYYSQCGNSACSIVGSPILSARGNIFARSSSAGAQFRTGGLVQNNLFLADPVGFEYGHQIDDTGYLLTTGTIDNNVVLNSAENASAPVGVDASGIVVLYCNGTSIGFTNNIVTWCEYAGPNNTNDINLDPNTLNVTFGSTNIIYNSPSGASFRAFWDQGTSNNISGTAYNAGGYPNPSHDIVSYCTSNGVVPATVAGFITAVKTMSKQNWTPVYTGNAVNTYIRAGFNR